MADSYHLHGETIDKTDKVISVLNSTLGAARAIGASEAFHKSCKHLSKPGLNQMGDFLGMVVSAEGRTRFLVSSKIGEMRLNAALVASLAEHRQGKFRNPEICQFAATDSGKRREAFNTWQVIATRESELGSQASSIKRDCKPSF